MRTIWKYQLQHGPGVEVELPEGHKVLGVYPDPLAQTLPVVYIEVESDDTELIIKRKFRFIGTGMDMGTDVYVGTVICHSFAWHVLEVML